MKTFIQIPCSDRLPEKWGKYITEKGLLWFDGDWHNNSHSQTYRSPDYWLEEIQLPTEEEIEKEAYKQYNQGHEYLTDECKAYIRGAKDLLLKLKPE